MNSGVQGGWGPCIWPASDLHGAGDLQGPAAGPQGSTLARPRYRRSLERVGPRSRLPQTQREECSRSTARQQASALASVRSIGVGGSERRW